VSLGGESKAAGVAAEGLGQNTAAAAPKIGAMGDQAQKAAGMEALPPEAAAAAAAPAPEMAAAPGMDAAGGAAPVPVGVGAAGGIVGGVEFFLGQVTDGQANHDGDNHEHDEGGDYSEDERGGGGHLTSLAMLSTI
jgi:hypothetical protein